MQLIQASRLTPKNKTFTFGTRKIKILPISFLFSLLWYAVMQASITHLFITHTHTPFHNVGKLCTAYLSKRFLHTRKYGIRVGIGFWSSHATLKNRTQCRNNLFNFFFGAPCAKNRSPRIIIRTFPFIPTITKRCLN